MNKQDIKDSLCRMQLGMTACLMLVLLLPKCTNEPQLTAIPTATTMGWVRSPATFCTMSETVCDLANGRFKAKPPAPNHQLELLSSAQDDLFPSPLPHDREPADHTANLALAAVPGACNWDPQDIDPDEQAPPSNCPHKGLLSHTNVFVEDFIQIGQGEAKRVHALRNHLLAAVDNVLARPKPGDNRKHGGFPPEASER
jgi:hypothetical protein